MNDQAVDRTGEAQSKLPRSVRIFRERFPAARIASSLVRLDEATAVVSVEVVLPDGGLSSSLGSCAATLDRAVEIAESRAMERALEGFGVSVAGEPAQSVAPTAPLSLRPAPETPAMQSPSSPPPVSGVRTEAAPPAAPATVRPEAPTASAPESDDPPLEDYSWTAFWNWARGHGYANRADLEQKLSVSINGMSPADVRVLIRERSGRS